jgi:enoyl-CoA hydratase
MEFREIAYEKNNGVAQITFNRPKVLNAINERLMTECEYVFDELEGNHDFKVLVVKSNGNAFSAGADMKEEILEPVTGRPLIKRRMDFAFRIWKLEQICLAAIQGYCLGAGLDFAMMCDLIIASEDARFGFPEVRQSAVPVPLTLPWIIGMKKAKELHFFGDLIDAREAERLGMVNRVVPLGQLEQETGKWVKRLLEIPFPSLKYNKLAINKSFETMGLRVAVDYGFEIGHAILMEEPPERKMFKQIKREKGLKAALEWRDSRFKG